MPYSRDDREIEQDCFLEHPASLNSVFGENVTIVLQSQRFHVAIHTMQREILFGKGAAAQLGESDNTSFQIIVAIEN